MPLQGSPAGLLCRFARLDFVLGTHILRCLTLKFSVTLVSQALCCALAFSVALLPWALCFILASLFASLPQALCFTLTLSVAFLPWALCFALTFLVAFSLGLHALHLRSQCFCWKWTGILSSNPSSPAKWAYSFLKSEMGFYRTCVQCDVCNRLCFKSHPRILGDVQ